MMCNSWYTHQQIKDILNPFKLLIRLTLFTLFNLFQPVEDEESSYFDVEPKFEPTQQPVEESEKQPIEQTIEQQTRYSEKELIEEPINKFQTNTMDVHYAHYVNCNRWESNILQN